MSKAYYTITELANILGISRVAVFKKIKAGKIKAERIGKMYVIPQVEYGYLIGAVLTDNQKKIIDKSVRKTIKDYGIVLKKLGEE